MCLFIADVMISVAVGVGVPCIAVVLIVIALLVYRYQVINRSSTYDHYYTVIVYIAGTFEFICISQNANVKCRGLSSHPSGGEYSPPEKFYSPLTKHC